MNNLFTQYSVKCNATGESWTEDFTALDARFVDSTDAEFADAGGLTLAQANRFVASMNRAQQNYKNEFTFSLN